MANDFRICNFLRIPTDKDKNQNPNNWLRHKLSINLINTYNILLRVCSKLILVDLAIF